MTRPNYTNKQDACCRCGELYDTPPDGQELTPTWEDKDGGVKQLGVWQPDALSPPQWICRDCHAQLEKDRRL